MYLQNFITMKFNNSNVLHRQHDANTEHMRTYPRCLSVDGSPVDIIQEIIILINLSSHITMWYVCLHSSYTLRADDAAEAELPQLCAARRPTSIRANRYKIHVKYTVYMLTNSITQCDCMNDYVAVAMPGSARASTGELELTRNLRTRSSAQHAPETFMDLCRHDPAHQNTTNTASTSKTCTVSLCRARPHKCGSWKSMSPRTASGVSTLSNTKSSGGLLACRSCDVEGGLVTSTICNFVPVQANGHARSRKTIAIHSGTHSIPIHQAPAKICDLSRLGRSARQAGPQRCMFTNVHHLSATSPKANCQHASKYILHHRKDQRTQVQTGFPLPSTIPVKPPFSACLTDSAHR